MSLITQCPACSTLFKVVPDQLRMSDGWVRCGQCDEVFDANATIRPDVSPTEAASKTVQRTQITNSRDDSAALSIDPVLGAAPLPHTQELADPFLSKSPKELSDFSAAVVSATLKDDLVSDGPARGFTSDRRYMQKEASDQVAVADPKLSFMKPVRAPSVWARRTVRAMLALSCVLLALLVALQVVAHERNRLAVQYPEYRAELASLCAVFGLEIEPLRQIEFMVIDSSAFAKVRSEVYKLSFTLRNTSATPLATPALELTLSDMQDQVLMRKVLTPSDFANVPTVMNAGAEVSTTLPVSVRMPVLAERVSGYRLLAFYP